ncbi:Rhophilin, Rho GTPase binding protein [Blyttiomyces sp. JEL0837]|nr:Rhophilin, Rho GTPase binding protein [Blyttiomyces sp. JEL0837]
MPPPPLLSVDLKSCEPIDFGPPLKLYIAKAYAESPAETYADDFHSLHVLRQDIMSLEVQEACLSQLIKYLTQLPFLMARFPMDEDNVRILFTWKDAYGLGRDRKTVSTFNALFEKACVMFNVGSMLSQLAKAQNQETVEGLKRSCSMFQNAAGCFDTVKSTYDPRTAASVDLQCPTLDALINAMLAQAQEMFYEKALLDKMKDGTIAKLAAATAAFYDEAYKNIQTAGILPTDWSAICQAKSYLFNAVAQYRRSKDELNAGLYGQQIGRLKAAQHFLKKATDVRGIPAHISEKIKLLGGSVKEDLARAEKDNDVIYLQTVPKIEELSDIAPAVMVKAKFAPELWMQGTPRVLFPQLVPFTIIQASSVYSDRKDGLVRAEIGRLEEADGFCQSTLVSLNLPGSLEAVENPAGIPQAVLTKAREIKDAGGAAFLDQAWARMVEARTRVGQHLDFATGALDEEEREDLQMRAQFRQSWTRMTSRDLTAGLRESLDDYRKKLNEARQSDELIRTKIESIYVSLQLFTNLNELAKAIPTSNVDMSTKNGVVVPLRDALVKLNQLITQRAALISDIRTLSRADEINSRLMESVSRKETFDVEAISTEELKKYDPVIDRAKLSIKSQDTLLANINALNNKFVGWTNNSSALKERERFITNLDKAYHIFKEVSENVREGQKFYAEFESVVGKLEQKCKDFAMTRSIDKQEVLSQLQRNAINPNPTPAPWNGQLVFNFNPNPPTSTPSPVFHPRKQ